MSGIKISDFDIMLNKNAFGISIYNAANSLEFPRSSEEKAQKVILCTSDKKNLDSKNPPKHPFNV